MSNNVILWVGNNGFGPTQIKYPVNRFLEMFWYNILNLHYRAVEQPKTLVHTEKEVKCQATGVWNLMFTKRGWVGKCFHW